MQSFAGAATKFYGSGTSLAGKPSKSLFSRSGDDRSSLGNDGSQFSLSDQVGDTEDHEVQSPLKQQTGEHQSNTLPEEGRKKGTGPSHQLAMEVDDQNSCSTAKGNPRGLGVCKLQTSTYPLPAAML